MNTRCVWDLACRTFLMALLLFTVLGVGRVSIDASLEPARHLGITPPKAIALAYLIPPTLTLLIFIFIFVVLCKRRRFLVVIFVSWFIGLSAAGIARHLAHGFVQSNTDMVPTSRWLTEIECHDLEAKLNSHVYQCANVNIGNVLIVIKDGVSAKTLIELLAQRNVLRPAV